MSKLRVAAAIVAMLLVQWSTGTLLALTTSINGSAIHSFASSFLGAGIGGFVATRSFMVPALAVWTVISVMLTYTLHSIASSAGDASWTDVIRSNAATLIASGVGVVSGVLIGQHISNRPRISAAA